MILNILFGPPITKKEVVLPLFFSLPGKHIVCGGTTSNMVSDYLNKPLTVELTYARKDVPPVGYIEGCDLVTEGILTFTRLRDMLLSGETPGIDAASIIYKDIQTAETVNFVCGDLTKEKKLILEQIISYLRKRERLVLTVF